MNTDTSQFAEVLERYGFAEPIPPEVQKHIRNIKSEQFIRTLRKAGKYSFIFGIVTSVFFAIKKMGVGTTIVKSALLVFASAVISLTILSSGIYLSFKFITAPEERIEEKREDVVQSGDGGIDKRIIHEKKARREIPEGVMQLGVQPFVAVNVKGRIALLAADTIAKKLVELSGSSRVINMRRGREGGRIGLMLLGSVEDLEGTYTITAKVVGVRDSKIVFYTSETVRSIDEIPAACTRIAERISKIIR